MTAALEQAMAIDCARESAGELSWLRAAIAVALGRQGNSTSERDEKGRYVAADAKGDIRTFGQRGTTEGYTLARLRRDAPELAQSVERGELSANAAAPGEMPGLDAGDIILVTVLLPGMRARLPVRPMAAPVEVMQ